MGQSQSAVTMAGYTSTLVSHLSSLVERAEPSFDAWFRYVYGNSLPTMFDLSESARQYQLRQISANEYVKSEFPVVQNWIIAVGQGLSRPAPKYISDPVRVSLLNEIVKLQLQVCSDEANRGYALCNTQISPKQSRLVSTTILNKVLPTTKRGPVDLTTLWANKCHADSVDPTWVDSLFCELGYGNPIAWLVMRMRFVVPRLGSNQHIMQQVVHAVDKIQSEETKAAVKYVLEHVTSKISSNKQDNPLTWNDLSTLSYIANKAFDAAGNPVANKVISLVDNAVQSSGISFAPRGSNKYNRKSIATARGPPSQAAGLSNVFNDKCVSVTQVPEWAGTLFCELGYNDDTANLIGKMKFYAPVSDPNNHAILQLINVLKGLASSKGGRFASLAAWNAFRDVTGKIERNELLEWEDLRNVFTFAAIDISPWFDSVLPYLKQSINDIGLDIG